MWLGALARGIRSLPTCVRSPPRLAQLAGASLRAHRRGRQRRGRVSRRRDSASRGGRQGGVAPPDLTRATMLQQPLRAYRAVRRRRALARRAGPAQPRACSRARSWWSRITPFASEELKRIAHVMLPIGTFAETCRHLRELRGAVADAGGAALPVGEARPGWKVLRVLGNLLNLQGFDYQSSDEVLAEGARAECAGRRLRLTRAATAWRPPRRVRAPSGARRCPMCPCTRSMRWCGARRRCRRRAKAARARELLKRATRCIEQLTTTWLALPGLRAAPPGWTLVITVVLIICVALLTLWERKVIGWMQLRRGPNRVRIFGLLPGLGPAVRRRLQAPHEGSHHPGERQQVPVPARADHCAGAGVRRLGGDSAVPDGGGVERRCGPAVPAVAHLDGRLRRHHRRLGGELEVRLPRRDALGGADGRLRDRHGLRAGRAC